MIFLDTSAIYALADRVDPNHLPAREIFRALLDSRETFLTHNYVLVESMALLHRRLGARSAARFAGEARSFEVHWIDGESHDAAVRRLRDSKRRGPSFVDLVSFIVMRSRKVEVAFAFDPHFEEEGFRIFRP